MKLNFRFFFRLKLTVIVEIQAIDPLKNFSKPVLEMSSRETKQNELVAT